MPVEGLQTLVRALLSHLPEDPSSGIITLKPDAAPPVTLNGQKLMADGPVYNPATVYILELSTVLALRDEETVQVLGSEVADALQNVIRDAANYHNTMISRAVFYLLNLLQASYVSLRKPIQWQVTNALQDHSFIRVPVVLHTISSFKKVQLEKAAPLILDGVNKCMREPGPLRNEIITSPDFWVILRTLSTNPQVAPAVFSILEGVVAVGSSPPAIMADNYESAVSLLNDFASAGSVGSAKEQLQDKRTRRGAQTKPMKPQSVQKNSMFASS